MKSNSTMPPSLAARAHVPPIKQREIRNVATLDEFHALTSAAPTVIKFSATWCGPCQRIAPVFATLAQSSGVTCAEADVDVAQDVAQAAGVRVMPTFQLWANGTKVLGVEGAKEDDLRRLFERASEGVGMKTA